MKIVCSTNMPFAREAFSTLGDVLVKEGRAISAADVRDAQILALRSTTQVNRALLEGSAVRFVGTATIGTDHLDIPYLEQRGIRWCFSPGCNANSVSEYVTSALLCLAVRHGFTLAGKTLGVIGVGNVGRGVVAKGEALGLRVLRNDPPRERQEFPDKTHSPFVSLEALLAESDIVTLHVPLTGNGPDRTLHLADRSFFKRLKRGRIFLNCARGPVVDSDDLLGALDDGSVSCAVIDTWEGEPRYRTDVLDRADLGTPHIAGHSFEGKVTGTVMVYREVCRFLGVEPSWTPDALLPSPSVPEIGMDVSGGPREKVLWEIVRRVYDIEEDDARLRATVADPDNERAASFDRLRRQYPVRREFRFTKVTLRDAPPTLLRQVSALGFATPALSAAGTDPDR